MKNNRTSPRLPLGGLRKTIGGAVRTILPTVSALLALLLPTACSEDAIEPAIDFSSPYVLTDDPTDAVRHACYEIYRQYGTPVFFNDTVATYHEGHDRQGNPITRYETLDLNWNFQSHDRGSVVYRFDYISQSDDRLQALGFARRFLARASRKMRPFSMMLADSIHVGAKTPIYHSGFRTLVMTQLKGMADEQMDSCARAILQGMVLDRVKLNTDLVARFGAVSDKEKYYNRPWVSDGQNGGLGCQWGVEHKGTYWRPQDLWEEGLAARYILYSNYTNVFTPEEFEAERSLIFREIGRYGFISGSSSYQNQLAHLYSPDNIAQDLEYFVQQMLLLGRAGFMQRYGESPLVKRKFSILAEYIEGELGVEL